MVNVNKILIFAFFLSLVLTLSGCFLFSPEPVVGAGETIGVSQFGGNILNNSVMVYFPFTTDCSDAVNNYDCELRDGASIVDGKLFLNRTVNIWMMARVNNKNLNLGANYCVAYDVIDYDYSTGYYFGAYFGSANDYDTYSSSGKMRVVYRNSTGSMKFLTSTNDLPSYTSKWSYIVSFNSTAGTVNTWLNGTADIVDGLYQESAELNNVELQIPHGQGTGIGYFDNIVIMNASCDQDFVDSWQGVSGSPVSSSISPVLNLSFDNVSDCGNDYAGLHSDFTKQGTADCVDDRDVCKWYGCLNVSSTSGDYLAGTTNFTLTDKLTVMFWLYPIQGVSGGDSAGYYEIGVSGTSDYLDALEGDYGLNSIWKSETGQVGGNPGSEYRTSANIWSHYAAVYDGSRYVLYKNGAVILNTSQAYGNLNYSISSAISIGKAIYGIDTVGYLDEFYIYNTSLSSSDVLSVYNAQSVGTPPTLDVYVQNVTYNLPRNWTDDGGMNEPILGESFQINTTIKNEGTDASGSFHYSIDWLNGTSITSGTTSLGAGSSEVVSYNVSIDSYTWEKIVVYLDDTQVLTEDNEYNNNYSINIPYMDNYWTLGHNSTSIQEALTYCASSGDVAQTACSWYTSFVSDDFSSSWTGNDVDPRGKKYFENAMGCLINGYDSSKSQCVRAFNHMNGWADLDPSTYTNVQAIHELIWVELANDIMFRNVSKADYLSLMSKYQDICQAVSTLSNTRPDLDPGLDESVIDGNNGWGFGAGIGSLCDLTTGNVPTNANNDLEVDDQYSSISAPDGWQNRVRSYLRAYGNNSEANYQERMLYKWYSQNKIVPVIISLNKAGIDGFDKFENAYCSMAKEGIYSLLDNNYNGATIFGDENNIWRQISAGDTNSYELVSSGTTNGWDIITYMGLLCPDNEVKMAVRYLRDLASAEAWSWRVPAVYNYYLLADQVASPSDIENFTKFFYDEQNDIATFRSNYTYSNDSVIQIDGGQHKMSGHPNAAGRMNYFQGYNFLAYNEVPYNDNTRTEVWTNTVSFSNATGTTGYVSSCGGAILNQYYGDADCSVIGSYPDFTYLPVNLSGDIYGAWGSDDGLYGGLLNTIPMVSTSTPIVERFIIANGNVVRYVEVVGSDSGVIYDQAQNKDNEILVDSLTSDNITFKAFDSNTYLDFSVEWSNETGTMHSTNTTVRYGFTKTGAPTGKGFYRRSYYQIDSPSAEYITTEVGYTSESPSKTTLLSSDYRGLNLDGEVILFDINDDGVSYGLFSTDAWGVNVINSTTIALYNATYYNNGTVNLSLPSSPYSGLLSLDNPIVECIPSLVNSSWSTPVLTECVDGSQDSSSYLIQSDSNSCGGADVVFWDNFSQSCTVTAPDFNSSFINGHSSLKFNVAPIVGNYTPLYGNPSVRVCNNGTASASSLNIGVDTSVPSDLRLFADTDSTVDGALSLDTSSQELFYNLAVDSCVDISFWLEVRDTTPTPFSFNVGYEVIA